MKVDEWIYKTFEGNLSSVSKEELVRLAWEAAVENCKPVANLLYVDYKCPGFIKNGNQPYWTVRNTPATVIKPTKEDCIKWALDNGFRVEI